MHISACCSNPAVFVYRDGTIIIEVPFHGHIIGPPETLSPYDFLILLCLLLITGWLAISY